MRVSPTLLDEKGVFSGEKEVLVGGEAWLVEL